MCFRKSALVVTYGFDTFGATRTAWFVELTSHKIAHNDLA